MPYASLFNVFSSSANKIPINKTDPFKIKSVTNQNLGAFRNKFIIFSEFIYYEFDW